LNYGGIESELTLLDSDPRLRRTYHENERADIRSLKIEADFLAKLALKYLAEDTKPSE